MESAMLTKKRAGQAGADRHPGPEGTSLWAAEFLTGRRMEMSPSHSGKEVCWIRCL